MTQQRLNEIRTLIKEGQYSDFDLGELLQAVESQAEHIKELKAELAEARKL